MDAASWSSLRGRPSGRCHASDTRREVRAARLGRPAVEFLRHLARILADAIGATPCARPVDDGSRRLIESPDPAPGRTMPPISRDLPRELDTRGSAVHAGDAGRDLAFASYLRVAAMSAVVLIHSCSAIVGNTGIRDSGTWWLATALDLGSSWAAPVFIMVSGALLLAPRPGEGARAFYARRVQRIAIPLVVAHVGYLLVRWLLHGEHLTVAGI